VDRHRPREVGQENDARLQQRDQQQIAAGVVARDLGAELPDTRLQLAGREEDVADPAVDVDGYDARSSR
jgi:hypothetical protein